MRPILAMKGTGTGTVSLYLINPYGATSFINYAGTIATTFFNTMTWGGSPGVQFGSKVYSRFYVTLFEYDTISGNNTSFRVPSDVNFNSGAGEWYNGHYIANVSGTWYLVQLYPTDGNGCKSDRYNFTTRTWSTSSSIHGISDQTFSSPKWQFGSAIYWILGASDAMTTNGTFYKLEISSNTGSSITSPSIHPNTVSMCSYNGNIYMVGHSGSSATGLRLYQMVGGSWQLAKTINSPGPSTDSSPTQMFTDGTYIYVIAYYASSGWKVFQLDNGLNVTDISSSVLPSYLLSNTGLDYQAAFKGVNIDAHADPSNPEIILTYTASSKTIGAGLSWFKWLGPSSQIQYLGDAGEGGPDYWISYSVDGGGQFIYSPGEPNIQVEGVIDAASTAGNVDVPFRVYESTNVPSGTLVDVSLFYSETPHPPRTRARITNVTPSGSQIDDYTVRVAATSGTLWGLEWRAAADGVTVGNRISATLYTSKANV